MPLAWPPRKPPLAVPEPIHNSAQGPGANQQASGEHVGVQSLLQANRRGRVPGPCPALASASLLRFGPLPQLGLGRHSRLCLGRQPRSQASQRGAPASLCSEQGRAAGFQLPTSSEGPWPPAPVPSEGQR